MLAFSLAVLAAWLALSATLVLGWRRMRSLGAMRPELPPAPPRLSVILAALDEERGIEAALRSLLACDYPGLEIIAIDDRSTDSTGSILDRLAAGDARLRVLHVRALPHGWLGKNHALWQGAIEARGDYLLFTDADVVFECSALRRAVAHCEAERLDHLTLLPSMPMATNFMSLLMLCGLLGMVALYRPWRPGHGLGVGAFNLVRAEAYRRTGGHKALAMEVLDDIGLGTRMRLAGGRQAMLLGAGMVSVEMYHSAGEFFRGVQKNVFTFMEYSAGFLVVATLASFALGVWPWLALFLTAGEAFWVNAATCATMLALYGHFAPRLGYSRGCVVYLPIYGVISIGLYWQVAIAVWLRGGIVWRGTRYPLAELRRARATTRSMP